MIAAFLESIKYVGHMWPLALVRIFIGFHFIFETYNRVQAGFLQHPYLSQRLLLSDNPDSYGIYFSLFKNLIQSQWLVMTYGLLVLEFVIGFSYALGFGVRIASLLGMVLSIHSYLFFDFPGSPGQLYVFYIHLLFCALGAGRCLGLDYYFFKSRRGLLW